MIKHMSTDEIQTREKFCGRVYVFRVGAPGEKALTAHNSERGTRGDRSGELGQRQGGSAGS